MIIIGFQLGLDDQRSDLAIDDVTITLRVKWNQRFKYWSLSIYDRDSNIILAGIKMVRDSPLISGLRIPSISGDFLFVRQYGNKDEADFESLGDDFVLVYVTSEEINAVVSSSS